ncbi:MAG: CoA-binding protein [Planctomycetota bacterium]|nr:CoA-binding protein [Planctomycetota bacterium]
MSKPSVAVLGASQDRQKFGNQSVRAHLQQGYEVFPINPKAGEIEGLQAYASLADLPVETVNRISVYLPPHIGVTLLDEIAAMQPDEVWLNPGSESDQLIEKAEGLGLNVIVACSIVDVNANPAG